MKKLGFLLMLFTLACPVLVGCGPSKKVDVPEEIPEESSRDKAMDQEEQANEAPAPPEEGEDEG